MAFTRIWRWLAAGIAPIVAACENGPAVVNTYDKGPALIESTLTYAGKDGPILAEIFGNPFGMDPVAFGRLVRDRLPDGVVGRVLSYTGTESQAPHPNIRIVVVFGPLVNVPGRRLCEGKPPELTFNPDKLTVRAVLCADGELLSDAEGWARNLEGPNDRRFRRLLGDLARALLSPPG